LETPEVPDLSFPLEHPKSCNLQVKNFIQTARKTLSIWRRCGQWESKIATAQAEDSVCCLVRGVKIGDKRCRGISVVCGVRIHLRNQLSESEWASSLRQAVCYRGKSPEFLLSESWTGSRPMRLSWSPSINLHVSWGNAARIRATHYVLRNHSQL
jgi:hypothetical protein